jgi:hypothetical protein
MRNLRLLAALPLAAAMFVPLSAEAYPGPVDVPEDCAVPPDIDLAQYNVLIGTDESEVLEGTRGPDFICGRLGDDTIRAFGDDDLILSDNTTFFGNPGAEGGDDLVFAGGGNDEVLPGPGDDTVFGGTGADFLALAVGDDEGFGGQGADNIIGGLGGDKLFGRRGGDMLAGGPGDDLVHGGRGNDLLAGELPPPPPGTEPPPLPGAPSINDVCIGGPGIDSAVDCDRVIRVED